MARNLNVFHVGVLTVFKGREEHLLLNSWLKGMLCLSLTHAQTYALSLCFEHTHGHARTHTHRKLKLPPFFPLKALGDFDEPRRSTLTMFGALTSGVRIYQDRLGYGIYAGPIGTAVFMITVKWVSLLEANILNQRIFTFALHLYDIFLVIRPMFDKITLDFLLSM